jgi:hypothetical protein
MGETRVQATYARRQEILVVLEDGHLSRVANRFAVVAHSFAHGHPVANIVGKKREPIVVASIVQKPRLAEEEALNV